MRFLSALLLSLLLPLSTSHGHPASSPAPSSSSAATTTSTTTTTTSTTTPSPPTLTPTPLPLVVWHGLGDAYDSPGLQRVADLYHLLYPNTFVYIISLSSNPNTDRSSTFLGSLPAQISLVCQQLLSLPSLSHGYHSLGFSQGGQFLRALIQSCPLPHLASHPPTSPPRPHALITFGAQHNGITSFLGQCAPFDVPCKTAAALLNRSKWSPWVQSHVVPAQYFRDPTDLDNYLAFSGWLADVNNERSRNESFAENLASLDNFVMYLFANDTTAIPKESAWFDDVDPDTGEITKLRDRDMYKEDWLGLRKLDEKGALTFLEVEGAHMEIADETLLEAFGLWCKMVEKDWTDDGGDDDDNDDEGAERKRKGKTVVLQVNVDADVGEVTAYLQDEL